MERKHSQTLSLLTKCRTSLHEQLSVADDLLIPPSSVSSPNSIHHHHDPANNICVKSPVLLNDMDAKLGEILHHLLQVVMKLTRSYQDIRNQMSTTMMNEGPKNQKQQHNQKNPSVPLLSFLLSEQSNRKIMIIRIIMSFVNYGRFI